MVNNEGMIIRRSDYSDIYHYLIQKRSEGEEFVAFNNDPFPVDRDELFTFNNQEEASQFCLDNVSDMDNYNYLAIRSVYRAMSEGIADNTLMIENGSGAIDISGMVEARYQRLENRHSLNEQSQTNKTNNVMEQKNLDYLKTSLKFMGFGEALDEKLEAAVKKGMPEFSLNHKSEFGSEKMDYNVNFKKGKEDMYFLNSYDATLTKEDGTSEGMRVYNDKGKTITAKESYNLLNGRAVHRPEIYNKKGEKYDAWVKFDYGVRDNKGKPLAETYAKGYGYDINAAIDKFPIKEATDPGEREKLSKSLEKGNRQAVHFDFKKNGEYEKAFVEANPKFKTLDVYDKEGKKVYLGKSRDEKVREGNTQGRRADAADKEGVKEKTSKAKPVKKQKHAKMKI